MQSGERDREANSLVVEASLQPRFTAGLKLLALLRMTVGAAAPFPKRA